MLGGKHGKNHTWSMGHYWPVAMLVFQATLASADFGYNDSQNLADCKSYLYTIMGDVHQLGFGGISTDVYLILQELGYMDDSLNEIEQDIDQISRQIGKIGDAILTPTDRQIKNQIAVTNIAETFWLQKINDSLHDVYNRLGIISNTNYWYLLGSGSGSPYANATAGNWDFKTRQTEFIRDLENVMMGSYDVQSFLYKWADYRMTGYDFFRSFDYNNMTPEDQVSFENGYRFYFGTGPIGAIRNYLKLFSNEGNLRQKFYGTYLLQNMSTNTFFSGLDVNNFFTNGVYLSQYATNAFQHVADSSGINTNQMFLGSYGSETNSDIFADITTNGLELVGSNSDYSSLGDDVSSTSLSNKVSMFNFTEKFDDSIKPFLDEIENASGGDWIINFGNIDLGDHFSFTIPALTVEKNETYLGFVDKFLNLLKIILGVVFFLILWRQLEQAVEST